MSPTADSINFDCEAKLGMRIENLGGQVDGPKYINICLKLSLEVAVQRCSFSKKRSENIQQMYKRTPIPKYDFNKVAKQLN